jgi:hypothetical protein
MNGQILLGQAPYGSTNIDNLPDVSCISLTSSVYFLTDIASAGKFNAGSDRDEFILKVFFKFCDAI